MENLDGFGTKEKKNGSVGAKLVRIGKIIIVLLAIVGALSLADQVSAFFDGTEMEPIYEVSVANVAKIMIDTNGDGGFDIQVKVDSLNAFRNIESDEVFLSVMGSLLNPGQ